MLMDSFVKKIVQETFVENVVEDTQMLNNDESANASCLTVNIINDSVEPCETTPTISNNESKRIEQSTYVHTYA